MAVGHVRYSTTGSSAWENAQPVYRSDRREVALAHNGNLINALELHEELRSAASSSAPRRTRRSSPRMLSTHAADTLEDALEDVMPRLEGAFSTVVMTKDSRRSRSATRRAAPARAGPGRRPLLRRLGVAARSTSSAREFLRDVQPGEMVSLRERGIETRQIVEGERAVVLRLRAHLLRAPRLAARGQPHAGLAPQDGRDPLARGAGRGRRRDRRAGLGQRRLRRATPRRRASRATTA